MALRPRFHAYDKSVYDKACVPIDDMNFRVNVVLSGRAGAAMKTYRPILSLLHTFLETSSTKYRRTYAIVSLGPDKMRIHRIPEE